MACSDATAVYQEHNDTNILALGRGCGHWPCKDDHRQLAEAELKAAGAEGRYD